MKAYVASGLENAIAAKTMMARLRSRGWEITYDWTEHGSVQSQGIDKITEVADKEVSGAMSADLILAILPGGRGTHVEIGMGIAAGAAVIVYDPTQWASKKDGTCAFYHASDVFFIETEDGLSHTLAEIEGDFVDIGDVDDDRENGL